MVQALVNISDDANRVLNIVKAREGLKDKSEAIMVMIEHYVECAGEPELKPGYLAKLKKLDKEKGISFKSIAELRKIIEG